MSSKKEKSNFQIWKEVDVVGKVKSSRHFMILVGLVNYNKSFIEILILNYIHVYFLKRQFTIGVILESGGMISRQYVSVIYMTIKTNTNHCTHFSKV
jgi:hypothetical protein